MQLAVLHGARCCTSGITCKSRCRSETNSAGVRLFRCLQAQIQAQQQTIELQQQALASQREVLQMQQEKLQEQAELLQQTRGL